ncbi:hypothetical protein LOZ12_002156 [Ophidiomyces ophidiicola]|uniref:Uncharacterized protein n=1 Tax=Ophidiomyces ophidiicola TaxID=1387563 RepID=A0ACB8UYZ0_9EURO|nr:uncharacterized protein LOZ57_004911 [Ophidiomyces ophidiicola]KAI1912122.1 hypothetical protein LOZ61_003472 [Ophidiomyces ophidiicola]KAI1921779.1 hypothetical protein LOZ64_001400 [Ophidiomyces ophidiicola]KAI1925409.1 hypothetical protein LOZ60_004214 [Ophidiomyces ophidiicola]KAI1944235.1 hypothetical protein LOZ57_004911 [Ophidiomyces ophidiicola]KAI1949353.1 hypothetical protein LOZ62_002317 [Ophidiomyces ophidiicola]
MQLRDSAWTVCSWVHSISTILNIKKIPNPPSPTVSWLLAHREPRQAQARGRAPLASLYRMYEYFVTGHYLGLRTEIEFFFNRSDWRVSDIPDPADPDPERYALLAVMPTCMVRAFNRLIERGLPRNAPAIIMGSDELDELQSRPRVLETIPAWCAKVPRLNTTLVIPGKDGEVPTSDVASSEFLEKNILAWDPPVYFV